MCALCVLCAFAASNEFSSFNPRCVASATHDDVRPVRHSFYGGYDFRQCVHEDHDTASEVIAIVRSSSTLASCRLVAIDG